jgi:hypothetical protein
MLTFSLPCTPLHSLCCLVKTGSMSGSETTRNPLVLQSPTSFPFLCSPSQKPNTGGFAGGQFVPGIVTQACTSHGHFGEYYQTHNIQEPTSCPCRAELQTREHIVFECQTHREYDNIINEGAPDHQLATLFGTKRGIDTLAKFVKKSKAFQKTRPTETL